MDKKKISVLDFQRFKDEGRRFAYVTAYDYTTASIVDESDVEVILVGDSLGMKATMDTAGYPAQDLVVLLTKGYQSADALTANKSLIGPETIVLSLQNGYGNSDEIVKFVPEEQIVLGTSGGGAIVAGPGHILHKGQGPTHDNARPSEGTGRREDRRGRERRDFRLVLRQSECWFQKSPRRSLPARLLPRLPRGCSSMLYKAVPGEVDLSSIEGENKTFVYPVCTGDGIMI